MTEILSNVSLIFLTIILAGVLIGLVGFWAWFKAPWTKEKDPHETMYNRRQ